MGWYEDGMAILERIHTTVAADPSSQHSEMALDGAHRQLTAAVSVGRVAAARELAARVSRLTDLGVGRDTALMSAAAAGRARLNILLENWPEAARLLCAALDGLPAAVPADLAAELSRLTAELLLGCGQLTALVELAPQALAAAYRQWGELHPQTLAALKMMADFALASGIGSVAHELSSRLVHLAGEVFGETCPLRQRARLDETLVCSRLTNEEDRVEHTHSWPVRPALLPVPSASCWLLDRTVADCHWLDEQIPPLLEHPQGAQYAQELSCQIMTELQEAARRCEAMFGPDSLRLARILTELGRQCFSLGMDGLLLPEWNMDDDCSEQLLRRAQAIHSGHGLASDHRDHLVTQITLGCLFTYSSMRLLLDGEVLFRAALKVCYGGERRQHLDLVEHCLRGLSFIYAQHEDTVRSAAMDDLLETVQAQRRRLRGQRVPAGGLPTLLPPRPWTDRQMVQRLTAALRPLQPATVALSGAATVALSGAATVAPSGAATVAPSGAATVALSEAEMAALLEAVPAVGRR